MNLTKFATDSIERASIDSHSLIINSCPSHSHRFTSHKQTKNKFIDNVVNDDWYNFCRWLSLLYVCREKFFKMER